MGLWVDPDLLAVRLRGRHVVLVSGTNGKTTTAAMVSAALGRAVAANHSGANMPAGLVSALVATRVPTAVLEVDEAHLPAVLDAAEGAVTKVVVLLNLSRDQLDRAGEVRLLADRWRGALSDPRHAAWVVIANVNDPLVAHAAAEAPGLVACAVPTVWLEDARSCPRCGELLDLAADGSWRSACGFARPKVDLQLDGELEYEGRRVPLSLALPGSFNRANAALAVAAAAVLGVDIADAANRVASVHSVEGRFSVRRWRGRRFRLHLAKNPAGIAALLPELSATTDDLVIAINSQIADGRDPSWLYDAPFEQLRGRHVWCDGERALDLAARLDYCGVAATVAADGDFPASVHGIEPIEVVANYTAFAQWLKKSSPS